jgi:type VI secretion system protein ImpM
MSRQLVPVNLVYFGKLPSRGDFVRSANHVQLIETLDRWLTQSVELLATESRWKIVYDAVAPMHFAIVGSRSRLALAGHLRASADASGRRFPFITAGMFEVGEPLAFMARSPLALSRLWTRFEQNARNAHAATEAAPVLQEMTQTKVDVEVGTDAYEANFVDFLEMQTLGSLQALLSQAGYALDVRQTLLAIGFLLQPVLAQGSASVEKGVVLPLPQDPLYRHFVATLWMDLMAPFLARGDFELAVFITTQEDKPALVVGFNGASPRTLQSVMDAQTSAAENIALHEAQWVEGYVGEDYGVKKLSSYLQQPELSLRQALATFRETFIGS